MEFSRTYGNQEDIARTNWDTKFFISETHINSFRELGGKAYSVKIPIKSNMGFKEVLAGVERITTVDNEMFIMLSDSIKRANQ